MNNINQAGTYAVYQLDQAIRSAGTGLANESATSLGLSTPYGCLLNIAKSGTKIAPQAGFPAPFNVTNHLRVAPVLIRQRPANIGGDVIVTMAGTSGLAELPTKFSLSGGSTTTNLNLENNVNFKADSKVLLVGAANTDCFVSQVNDTFTASEHNSELPLAGDYHKASIGGDDITNANEYVLNLGQVPNFNMFGVGDNNTLFSYNIFEPNNAAASIPNPSVLINNVVQLQALYGIDVAGVIQWVQPSGATYGFNSMKNNIAAISSIKAIKLAVIMKTDLQEKERVSNNKLYFFSDTNEEMSFNVTGADRKFRHQVFEVTIPVRNSLLQP